MDIKEHYKQKSNKKEKSEFREKVMAKLGMSYPAFMSRMQRNVWRKLEIEAIEEIIKEEQYGTEEMHCQPEADERDGRED
jgi:hypothetical protein